MAAVRPLSIATLALGLVLVPSLGYADAASRTTLTGDWSGARTRLEQRGITLSLVSTHEMMRTVHGGNACEIGRAHV